MNAKISQIMLVRECNNPFYCPHCRLELQCGKIFHLKVVVTDLTLKMTKLRKCWLFTVFPQSLLHTQLVVMISHNHHLEVIPS